MRKIWVLGVLCAMALAPAAHAETSSDDKEAQAIVKDFFTRLKAELQDAMKAGGPVHAIFVCRDRAPAIAQELSDATGWQVGRTSLKLRNPALNAPDGWEEHVLLEFEQRKTAGEDVRKMTRSEVVEGDEGSRYRFMKAIPTGEVCLVCHGETISPDIAAAIDEAYPEDQAKGFALGDIRGAFTLSKPK